MHRPPDRCQHQAVDGLNQYSASRKNSLSLYQAFSFNNTEGVSKACERGFGRAHNHSFSPAGVRLAIDDKELKRSGRFISFIYKKSNQVDGT